MPRATHADACRLRIRDLLKIAEGLYDNEERLALERMIREYEELVITAGPRRPKAAKRAVSRNGSGGRSAARKAAQASNRPF
jgi:hypothetical protein